MHLAGYFTGVTTNVQMGGYGTLDLNGAYTWDVNARALKSVKFELHVDNALNRHAPFYSPGIQVYDPSAGYSGAPFMWEIYNAPLFVSLNVSANLY